MKVYERKENALTKKILISVFFGILILIAQGCCVTQVYGAFNINGISYEVINEKTYGYEAKSAVRVVGWSCNGILNIPSTVTNSYKEYAVIGIAKEASYASSEEKNITEISGGSNIKYIGQSAFSNCNYLKKVSGFLNVVKVHKDAFHSCSKLIKVDFLTDGKYLNEIGEGAFYNTGLGDKLMLSSSTTQIGQYAFYECKNLKRLEIRNFSSFSVNRVSIVNENTQLIIIEKNGWKYELNVKDKKAALIYVPENSDSKVVTIDETIADAKISRIGENCFSLNNLNEIHIGKNVEKIGDYAFLGCENLKKVFFKGIPEMGRSVFSFNIDGFPRLKGITFYCEQTNTNAGSFFPKTIYEKYCKDDVNSVYYKDNGNWVKYNPEKKVVIGIKHEDRAKLKDGKIVEYNITWTFNGSGTNLYAYLLQKKSQNSDNWATYDGGNLAQKSTSTLETVLKENGTYRIIVSDANHNASHCIVEIKDIGTESAFYGVLGGLGDIFKNITGGNSSNGGGNGGNTEYIEIDSISPEIQSAEPIRDGSDGWGRTCKFRYIATDNVGITAYRFYKKGNSSSWKSIDSRREYKHEETVKEDGTYIFEVRDAQGNSKSVTWTINCIDTKVPIIKNAQFTVENNKGQIKLLAEDEAVNGRRSGIEYYKLTENSNGTGGQYKRLDNNIWYMFEGKINDIPNNAKKTFYIVVKDQAGNESKPYKIEVDTTRPEIVGNLIPVTFTGKKLDNIHYFAKDSKFELQMTTNKEVTIDKSMIASQGFKLDVKGPQKSNGKIVYNIILTANGQNVSPKEIVLEEGFLKDKYGNKSKKDKIEGTRFAAKITGPTFYETTLENGYKKIRVTDTTLISKYSWVTLDDQKKENGKIKEKDNVYLKEVNQSFKVENGYIKFVAEDILGNKSTILVRSTNTNVEFVKREKQGKGVRLTYRINSYFKANISDTGSLEFLEKEGKFYYEDGPFRVYGIKNDPEDTTGKKFLIDIETTEETDGSVELAQGAIYVEDPHSSREPFIVINVDNKKPEIENITKNLDVKSINDLLEFKLKDSNSGIKRYQILSGDKVLRDKIITTPKKEYEIQKTIIENGTYTIKVWDAQDNYNEYSIEVNNIERTAIKINQLEYKLNENGKVQVSITSNKAITADEWTNSEDKKTITKEFEEMELTGLNIQKSVIIKDEVNNQININLKDKIAPRLVGEIKKTKLDNGKTKIEAQFTEELKFTEFLKNEGWTLSEDKLTVSKETNEDQELIVEDIAGNDINQNIVIKITDIPEENPVEKIVKNAERSPADRFEPTTEVIKKIYLNRAIQKENISMGESLQKDIDDGKVTLELSEDSKVLTLKYKENTDYDSKILFKENDRIVEKYIIKKVKNIVIKGDSNNDGKINEEDGQLMVENAYGVKNGQDPYKIFAMDMDSNGKIDAFDFAQWLKMYKSIIKT